MAMWSYGHMVMQLIGVILSIGQMAGSNGRLIDVLHDHDVILLMKKRSWPALVGRPME